MRLLVIEGDSMQDEQMVEQLCQHYIVDTTELGCIGIEMASDIPYGLIIINLGVSDAEGVETCTILRSKSVRSPILVLSTDYNAQSRLRFLEAGADDYLIKPFRFTEFQARIRSMTRRGLSEVSGSTLQFDELSMDTATRTVRSNGKEFYVIRKEFDMLELLILKQNTIVTREMLFQHAWDDCSNDMTNTVDVHLGRLRKRMRQILGYDIIKTVYGYGYRLESFSNNEVVPLCLLEDGV